MPFIVFRFSPCVICNNGSNRFEDIRVLAVRKDSSIDRSKVQVVVRIVEDIAQPWDK